jgi:hypothetical protein
MTFHDVGRPHPIGKGFHRKRWASPEKEILLAECFWTQTVPLLWVSNFATLPPSHEAEPVCFVSPENTNIVILFLSFEILFTITF